MAIFVLSSQLFCKTLKKTYKRIIDWKILNQRKKVTHPSPWRCIPVKNNPTLAGITCFLPSWAHMLCGLKHCSISVQKILWTELGVGRRGEAWSGWQQAGWQKPGDGGGVSTSLRACWRLTDFGIGLEGPTRDSGKNEEIHAERHRWRKWRSLLTNGSFM